MPDYTDLQIRDWAYEAQKHAGSFVCAIATAALAADDSNFKIIRPVLVQLMEKYPFYLKWAERNKAMIPGMDGDKS